MDRPFEFSLSLQYKDAPMKMTFFSCIWRFFMWGSVPHIECVKNCLWHTHTHTRRHSQHEKYLSLHSRFVRRMLIRSWPYDCLDFLTTFSLLSKLYDTHNCTLRTIHNTIYHPTRAGIDCIFIMASHFYNKLFLLARFPQSFHRYSQDKNHLVNTQLIQQITVILTHWFSSFFLFVFPHVGDHNSNDRLSPCKAFAKSCQFSTSQYI